MTEFWSMSPESYEGLQSGCLSSSCCNLTGRLINNNSVFLMILEVRKGQGFCSEWWGFPPGMQTNFLSGSSRRGGNPIYRGSTLWPNFPRLHLLQPSHSRIPCQHLYLGREAQTFNCDSVCAITKEDVLLQEWNSAIEKLKSQALEILLSKDFTEKEHLQLSNQKLSRLQEEFGRLMVERKAWLTMAHDFFNRANKVSVRSRW